MRFLYDFECEDGHRGEQFTDVNVRESTCRICDKPATRVVCAPRAKLNHISGDFPGATEQWAKKREKHMQLERKAAENHGQDAVWDMSRR
jgi:hypothetical protein